MESEHRMKRQKRLRALLVLAACGTLLMRLRVDAG